MIRWILGAVAMIAAAVLLAAGQPLPSTVVGVLADCGYTSPKEIIRVVIRKMKLPFRCCFSTARRIILSPVK